MDLKKHRKQIMEAALAGYDTPAKLGDYLFAAKGLEKGQRDELLTALGSLLYAAEFNSELQRAREDIVGTALESFKETAMENVLAMKDMARDCTDERVKYSANKDILDRIGLAPAQKQVTYSPQDYMKLLAGLQSKEKAEDAETRPGGVVQTPEIHSEGQPTGHGGSPRSGG